MRHLLRHRYIDYELIENYEAKYVKPPLTIFTIWLRLYPCYFVPEMAPKRVLSDI